MNTLWGRFLCAIGIHDWQDYEIQVHRGQAYKEENIKPEQHFHCSRCPMFRWRNWKNPRKK